MNFTPCWLKRLEIRANQIRSTIREAKSPKSGLGQTEKNSV
jgi:hypothetical protein